MTAPEALAGGARYPIVLNDSISLNFQYLQWLRSTPTVFPMSRARHHPKTGGGETGEKPMIARFIAMTVLVGALLCAGAEAVQWATSGHYDTLTGIEL